MELTKEEAASYEALAEELDPKGEKGLEEATRKLKERFDVDMNAVYITHPMTETAVREVIKAMREREGSEE